MHGERPDDGQDPKEKINYKATFHLLLGLVKTRKLEFAAAFAFLIASTLINLANPIVARYLIDTAIPAKNQRHLFLGAGLYFANSVLFLAFNYFMSMRLIKTGQSIIVELKERMLRHLLSLDLEFYSANQVGRLNARVQSDTGALYELFTETAVTIFKDLFTFAAVFAIMAFYDLKLTLMLMPLFPAIFAFTWLFVRKSSPLFVAVRKMTAEISAFLTEHLNGIGVIQAFSREASVAAKLDALNEKKFKTDLQGELYAVVFFLSVLFLHPASTAAIFGAGGALVLKGKLTVGVLVMFILYLGQLFDPIFRFSEHISIIQRSFSAGHRIFRILELRSAITEPAALHYLTAVHDAIEFRNVSMRYAPGSEWALKDVSFRLPKGSSMAIVGETGGGKTTVANLLFRFYPFEKGRILIDGTEISAVSLKSLRSAVGLVQQDIYLFPGTVMDNLKMMDTGIPDAKVHEAVRLMGLEPFFKKHPLTKTVVEKGANLSIGEKQVIALARAMVLDQEVLVLDEATSHMDPYTERLITGAVKHLLRHKTLIIIAHRLSTVKSVDKILLVSGGEIKEAGTHEELLAKGGIYSRFYKLQFGDD
ncbi:MAG: ABC transporter ATP-binding protein [Elusimicrobiales bacterium]|jgi:ABC-type multidrug transport system fused ATPase/permease subunit